MQRKNSNVAGILIFIFVIACTTGIAFLAQNVQIAPLFSKVVTVQVSVLILIVFAMINFMLIINFLYTTYTSSRKALATREQEKQIDRAKNEFIALISHQLRTPLSAINWYAEALVDGDRGIVTEQQKEYLLGIQTSNQRMTALINSIIDVSRIELHTFITDAKPTKIFPLIESILESFKEQLLAKKITLHKNYSEYLCTIRIDARYVRMVLEHVLSNAIKYTPSGGRVDVTVTCEHDMLHMTITDTGYGIPEQELAKVFSKLFRASNIKDKDTDGAGISLYIVKSIVDYAGGNITVQSKENVGTTFSVHLPARIE